MYGPSRRTVLAATGAAGLGGLLAAPVAAAGHRKERVGYLGGYAEAGLTVVTRPPRGPELTAERTVAVPDASWLVRHRNTLYVTNERVPEGSVTALDVRDPRRPTVLGSRPTLGGAPTHLAVHPGGRHLLTANYADGSVVVHPIRDDGGLGEATDLVRHTGEDRQAHAHQVLPDPSGRWVLAVDLGADSVYVYRLDPRRGRLAERDRLRLPPGAGPRHLAFHPNGRVAYVLGELRPEITVARWDAACGRLTPVATVPTVPDDVAGPQYPAEILVSADGRFCYATNRGEDTIVTFAVAGGGTRLTRLGSVPTGGVWPRHFALDATGGWFHVANQRSGTVTWLPRDRRTGLPGQPAGTLPLPSAAFVAV
ncbi:6-phosphogluconolactonase (cycloisomerase 2 family) [Prauserella shujinwangii]|uniref:6-phosphogluconolactonase (Cycloisomerase 2 family) n=1 Tax=Prauserella shujinwangii TaxID=1453103 RepID=A0A2T0LSW3_9PSEU|nr:lactonase family protein [Prauserella shujinwangii]PRX46760.1 6-phosphogluconolactonase (cycloisomerase 2 family) [Prauserella shujinwangii]